MELDIKPFLNNLETGDKRERKKALENIYNAIFKNSLNVSEPELNSLFEQVRLHLLKTFSDPSESCRELSIDVASEFIKKLPINSYYLTYIVPLLVRRLGQIEKVEPSEELRLKLMQLLTTIIETYANRNALGPFYDDFVNILIQTLNDNFPSVKNESCFIILKLVEYLQRDFHVRADELVLPVSKILNHQHSKLRAIGVEAIGHLCLHSTKLDDCLGALGGKLLDSSPLVRRKVSQISGLLLLTYRDRYSYWHRLIPLILCSITDESEDIATEAQEIWEKVGEQYQNENEADLKDRMDYMSHLMPDRYPEGVTRPSLGCRVLVERNITRIVPVVGRELLEWRPEVRIRAAQMLKIALLHAERGGTQGMSLTINAIVKGIIENADNPSVVEELEKSCEILGCLMLYSTWGPLIEPLIEANSNSALLRTLAHFLKGSVLPMEDKEHISEILVDKNVCQNRKLPYLRQLLKCVEYLLPLERNEDDMQSALFMEENLYTITMTALALSSGNDRIKAQAIDMLHIISDSNVQELHERHLKKLFNTLMRKNQFSGESVDCMILETVLLNCSAALRDHWGVLCTILSQVFQMETDMKIKMFTTLAIVFLDWQPCQNEAEILEKLIKELISPSLIWAAGKLAESCRTAAMSALCALMQTAPQARSLLPGMIPHLITLLDDDTTKTRYFTLKTITLLPSDVDRESLGELFLALGKRLDDGIDSIRMGAAEALGSVALIGEYQNELKKKDKKSESNEPFVSEPILLDIFKTTILHLDDRDTDFRDCVLDSLKKLGANSPVLMLELANHSRPSFRNKQGMDDLMEHMKIIKL